MALPIQKTQDSKNSALNQANKYSKSLNLFNTDGEGLTNFKSFFDKYLKPRKIISWFSLISIGGLPFEVLGTKQQRKLSNSASSIVTNSNNTGSDSFIKKPTECSYTIIIQDMPLAGFLTKIFLMNLVYGKTQYSTILSDSMAYLILMFENFKQQASGKDTLATKEGFEDTSKKEPVIGTSPDKEYKEPKAKSNETNTSYKMLSFIQFVCIRLYLGLSIEQFTEGNPQTTIDRIKKSYSTDFLDNEKLSEGFSQLMDNYSSKLSSFLYSEIIKTFDSRKFLKNAFNQILMLFKNPLPKEFYTFLIELVLIAQRSSGRMLSIHTPNYGWSNAVIENLTFNVSTEHSNLILADIDYKNYDAIKTRYYLQTTTETKKIVKKETKTPKKESPAKKQPIIFNPFNTYSVPTNTVVAGGVSYRPVGSQASYKSTDESLFFEKEVYELAKKKKVLKKVNRVTNFLVGILIPDWNDYDILYKAGHSGGNSQVDYSGIGQNYQPFFVKEENVDEILNELLEKYSVFSVRNLTTGQLIKPLTSAEILAYKNKITYPKSLR
jgi:hypothetical protein